MATFGHEFCVGLLAVVIFSNGFSILITALTWWGMYHKDWVIASAWWAPLEMLSALSYLFLFGARFYLGPVVVFVAALARIAEAVPLQATPPKRDDVAFETGSLLFPAAAPAGPGGRGAAGGFSARGSGKGRVENIRSMNLNSTQISVVESHMLSACCEWHGL